MRHSQSRSKELFLSFLEHMLKNRRSKVSKKVCIIASPAVIQGMAYATAVERQRLGAYIQNLKKEKGSQKRGVTCVACRQTGHISKHCPHIEIKKGSNPMGGNGIPKGLCPRCKKGRPWKNKYRFKFHKDGTPLTEKEKPKNEEGDIPSAP